MLSDQGRADAAQIGEAIRGLRIPISEVRCSEYCRAVETARLLSLGVPKTDPRLNGWPAWKAVDPEHGVELLAQGTRELLAARPVQGNVLLVSHKQDFVNPSHPVLADLKDGESAVFNPDGRGGFVLRGRIKAEYYSQGTVEGMFTHAQFRDATAVVFLKVGASAWSQFAAVPVERRIGSKTVEATAP